MIAGLRDKKKIIPRDADKKKHVIPWDTRINLSRYAPIVCGLLSLRAFFDLQALKQLSEDSGISAQVKNPSVY